VRDGKIEKMFIEADLPGDPFDVSDADTMLEYLDPDAAKPFDVAVFSRPGCPHCARAKGLLHAASIDFEELVLNRDYTDRTLRAISDATTYPQVFVNAEHIGGAEEVEAWLNERRQIAA
jgi:glutaredoxin-like protein